MHCTRGLIDVTRPTDLCICVCVCVQQMDINSSLHFPRYYEWVSEDSCLLRCTLTSPHTHTNSASPSTWVKLLKHLQNFYHIYSRNGWLQLNWSKCELSGAQQGQRAARNECLGVLFKVCVNTAWIDVWERTAALTDVRNSNWTCEGADGGRNGRERE